MAGAAPGILGLVTSWTGTFNTALISTNNKPASFELNETAGIHDRTTFVSGGATFGRNIHGLHTWDGNISAHLGTPATGSLGLITFAAGEVLLVSEYELNITANMHDTTVLTSGGVKWRSFTPGLVRATGSFSGYLDNATSIAHAGLDAGASAATFDVVAGSKSIGGNIILSEAGISVSPDDANRKKYNFVFDSQVTTAGSGTILWAVDAGGGTYSLTTPVLGTLTMQSYTSQTFAGSAAYKSLKLKVNPFEPIILDIGFQGSGALTGPSGVA